MKVHGNRRLFIDVSLEKSGETVEVAVGLDVADDSDEGFAVDKLLEGDEVELQLAENGDHDAVEPLFDERAIGADTELTAEHDIEGFGLGTARLVTELQAGDLAAGGGLALVFV